MQRLGVKPPFQKKKCKLWIVVDIPKNLIVATCTLIVATPHGDRRIVVDIPKNLETMMVCFHQLYML
jgi:hypothetical protein